MPRSTWRGPWSGWGSGASVTSWPRAGRASTAPWPPRASSTNCASPWRPCSSPATPSGSSPAPPSSRPRNSPCGHCAKRAATCSSATGFEVHARAPAELFRPSASVTEVPGRWASPSRGSALGVGGALIILLAVTTGAIAASGSKPAPAAGNPARTFAFGLWGDMPYAKKGDGPKIPALIADMNNDHELAFTAFDGDIKDGSSLCTDDQYTSAIDRFNQLQAPTVYVPGDNEWTDCHRLNDGGYKGPERLDHV